MSEVTTEKTEKKIRGKSWGIRSKANAIPL